MLVCVIDGTLETAIGGSAVPGMQIPVAEDLIQTNARDGSNQ